ncbi:hypothetical protein [Actinoplanes sp. CA-252034]|uniref:hypothetical protein n=1 Tax=Actinoplanes sp. CA-252034 TaxID=3239906 RepID=UPI003D993014
MLWREPVVEDGEGVVAAIEAGVEGGAAGVGYARPLRVKAIMERVLGEPVPDGSRAYDALVPDDLCRWWASGAVCIDRPASTGES